MSDQYPDTYTWKSATGTTELVEIHPGHADYGPGKYFIGVYGCNEGSNRFSILCYLKSVKEITPLIEGVPVNASVSDWSYYKVLVKHAGESRIVVTVSPGEPVLSLFVSPTQMYPSEKEHYCSAGYFAGRAKVYRPEIDFDDAENIYDADPFDETYPRTYVQNLGPNGQLLDRVSGKEELTICLDTDEWIANSRVCHIAVKNMTRTPVNFSITGREIWEKELLSETDLQRNGMIHALFATYDLVDISYAERLRKDIAGEREFTYGEVDYVHFRSLFDFCHLQPGEEFWDLGSGAGKCLLTVSLCHPFLSRVVGVELLDDLHELSSKVMQTLPPHIAFAPITVIHGDIFKVDWSSADCIYTSNLCFPYEQLVKQAELLQRVKAGTRVISLVLFKECAWLRLCHSFRVKMTWGKAEVYLYTKIGAS